MQPQVEALRLLGSLPVWHPRKPRNPGRVLTCSDPGSQNPRNSRIHADGGTNRVFVLLKSLIERAVPLPAK